MVHGWCAKAAWAAVVVVLSGCGAAMQGGAAGEDAVFRMDLGRATPNDIARDTRKIFTRFHYEIERSNETAHATFFESRWRRRYPLEDEIAMDIAEVQTRVTIRASAMQSGTGLARVEFIGETLVRMAEESDYRRNVITEQARQQFERMTRALKTEFDTGIRVRGVGRLGSAVVPRAING